MIDLICTWLWGLICIIGLATIATLLLTCLVALLMFIWEMICP